MTRSAAFTYGYVVGVLVSSRGDGSDEDRYPDVVAASVQPTFTRVAGQYRQPLPGEDGGAHGMFVTHDPVVTGIMPDGHLTADVVNGKVALDATPGVWLVTGVYRVSAGGYFPDFDIEVTADHTVESPLDLYAAAPVTPGPATPVNVLSVPAGASAGELLSWGAGGLTWVPASGSGGTTDHSMLTNRDDADQHPIGAITGLRSELDGKADATHNHDDRYYTETEADDRFVRTVNGNGPDEAGNVVVSGGGGSAAAMPNLRVLPDTWTSPYGSTDGSGGTDAWRAGRAYFYPYPMFSVKGGNITLTSVATNITVAAAAGSTIRFGLYGMASDGGVDFTNKLFDITFPTDTTGGKTLVLDTPVTVPPGIYWMGAVMQGASCGVFYWLPNGAGRYMAGMGGRANMQASNQFMSYALAGVTGQLPTTPQTLGEGNESEWYALYLRGSMA